MMKDGTPLSKFTLVESMLLGSSIGHLMRSGAGVREKAYYEELSSFINVKLFEYYSSGGKARNIIFKNKWLQSTLGALCYIFYVERSSIDIVRSKQLYGCWAGWILSVILGKPHVVRCGYIWSRSFTLERGLTRHARWLIEKIEDVLLRSGDAYIFGSQDIYSFYSSRIDRKPYLILPNYVDIENFCPNGEVASDHDFLYVGRFIDLKGVTEAADFVRKNNSSNTSTFVGAGPLEDYVLSAGINVVSAIPNNELKHVMNKHRFFLSLSKTEGSPKALLEGIFCGMFPILSDIPAHREIVDNLGYGKIISGNEFDSDNLDSCEICENKLSKFIEDYSMEKHIAREVGFLRQCAK